MVFNGLVHFQIGDSFVTFSNIISGPGGFYWDNYNNAVVFAAANTYQGITDIRSGRTLALAGNGSIADSVNISLSSSATLDVTARNDATLTLTSGQVLQGNGELNGSLNANNGATVVPGGSNTIGTLTVTGAAVLSGTTLVDVSKSAGTFDQLSGATSIAYGGALVVNNLGGTLAVGDSFTLFSAGSYSGTFSGFSPTTPGAGLAWSLSGGTLSVIAGSTPATITGAAISAGKIVISARSNNSGTTGNVSKS